MSFLRNVSLIVQVLKRVGLGVAAGFLAGSNIATQRVSVSVYHRLSSDANAIGGLQPSVYVDFNAFVLISSDPNRYRKYLELRDGWHIQEGTGEEGDALSILQQHAK